MDNDNLSMVGQLLLERDIQGFQTTFYKLSNTSVFCL